MIPTVLLAGLLVGRWWAVPLLALLWPAVLVVLGTVAGLSDAAASAAFAAVNGAVGVALHRLVAAPLRRLGRRRGHPGPA